MSEVGDAAVFVKHVLCDTKPVIIDRIARIGAVFDVQVEDADDLLISLVDLNVCGRSIWLVIFQVINVSITNVEECVEIVKSVMREGETKWRISLFAEDIFNDMLVSCLGLGSGEYHVEARMRVDDNVSDENVRKSGTLNLGVDLGVVVPVQPVLVRKTP